MNRADKKNQNIFQKSNIVFTEMTPAEWIRRKSRVPRKFLSAWTRTPKGSAKSPKAG